ncbi:hypothetical protein [Dactylosporangium fulvum]|uniref:Uncharacterized protein n=1 Tax=Dactylosporangium fulvum TaxID=53359 RepID=A0ABY5VZ01_9ACTN|nr:hypothetical protein [Dactylosporangium fulvum]UWP82341.1 hypothetical protein Dfulv_46050 [Dactylosporangium fulvum]
MGLGRDGEAADACRRAIELSGNAAEQRFLAGRTRPGPPGRTPGDQ